MTVFELAREAGVSPSAVRFYLRAGVLGGPHVLPDGRRGYDRTDAEIVRTIVSLRRLGFDDPVHPAPPGEARPRQEVLDEIHRTVEARRVELARRRAELERVDAQLAGLERLLGQSTGAPHPAGAPHPGVASHTDAGSRPGTAGAKDGTSAH